MCEYSQMCLFLFELISLCDDFIFIVIVIWLIFSLLSIYFVSVVLSGKHHKTHLCIRLLFRLLYSYTSLVFHVHIAMLGLLIHLHEIILFWNMYVCLYMFCMRYSDFCVCVCVSTFPSAHRCVVHRSVVSVWMWGGWCWEVPHQKNKRCCYCEQLRGSVFLLLLLLSLVSLWLLLMLCRPPAQRNHCQQATHPHRTLCAHPHLQHTHTHGRGIWNHIY